MVHLLFRMQAVHRDMMKHVMNSMFSNVLTVYPYSLYLIAIDYFSYFQEIENMMLIFHMLQKRI